MSAIRSLIFNIAFYGLTVILALGAVLASFIPGYRPTRALFRFWARSVVFLVKTILGARIDIIGREHLPASGPILLASKHQSELDAAMMVALFPDLAAIAMQDLDKYPFIGRIMTKLGHIKVNTEGGQKQLPQVVAGAKRAHDKGRPILIFPEGHLMAPGRKKRYRSGVWHIQDALAIPVIPVALDLGLIWERRLWRKTPGARAAVKFLPPIAPGMEKEPFMHLLEDRIERETNALIREHAAPETLAGLVFEHEAGAPGRLPSMAGLSDSPLAMQAAE